MSVMNRLQRLTGEKPADGGAARPGEGARAEEIRVLRERIDAVLSRRPEERRAENMPFGRGRGVPLEELVTGAETANEAGGFFCGHPWAGGPSPAGGFFIRGLVPL